MMDYDALCGMIDNEKAHYEEIDRRRRRAVMEREPRDVLALYDRMQQQSVRALAELTAQRYRQECK